MTGNQIALDVMGGDEAPGSLIGGALKSCSREGAHRTAPEKILLVGDPGAIETELAARGGNPGFEIQPASQIIEMGESPSRALRAKRDSSIGLRSTQRILTSVPSKWREPVSTPSRTCSSTRKTTTAQELWDVSLTTTRLVMSRQK